MLSERVHTFGQWLMARHGERVHKIALDAGFTCPNRRDSRQGTRYGAPAQTDFSTGRHSHDVSCFLS